MGIVKLDAKKLIDALPDEATWDDIMYEFYVKKKLDSALREVAAGDVVSHEGAERELSSK